jgi:cytidine deaminase
MLPERKLIDAAIELLLSRFPSGPGTASAMCTEDGMILTSVCIDSPNNSASLCAETGAICEAHKLGKMISASACVFRKSSAHKILIIPPCGICIERLFFWGANVQVAVPDQDNPLECTMVSLKEMSPHYWGNVLEANDEKIL